MIKSELIQKLAEENPTLFRMEAERIVDAIFEAVEVALSNGDRVELRGFGIFLTKRRTARVARNPRTGEPVKVEAKSVLQFRPGKELRQRLNAAEAMGRYQ